MLVQVQEDRSWLWKSIGYTLAEHATTVHNWWEPLPAERDKLHQPWNGNKSGRNLTEPPLPYIGSPGELWSELVSTRFDLSEHVSQRAKENVARMMDGLSRPLFLLHTRGITSSERKSYPAELERAVINSLLDIGSVGLLDWHGDGPRVKSGRFRVFSPNLEELYWLITQADLFLGCDSGPYHFTRLTRTPRVGVWFDIPAWHACIPALETVNVVRPHGNNPYKRFPFNMVELPKFSGEGIANVVTAVLAPRRFSNLIGPDLVLQNLLPKLRHGDSNLTDVVDRNLSFGRLFNWLKDRPNPVVVETGCIREPKGDDWGAGWFTALCGYMLKSQGGRLTSVDLSPENCRVAMEWTQGLPVSLVQSDSVAFLQGYSGPKLDVLYLDSLDTDHPNHGEHCLEELRAGIPHLKPDAKVVIDDSPFDGSTWVGKGKLAIPYLIQNGWKHELNGYQSMFTR